MLVQGDLKCLHCGFVIGQWVGEKRAPLLVSGLRPRDERQPPDSEAVARCSRCDGPVYLDDANPVASSQRLNRIRRLRMQLAEIEARKAGPARKSRAA